MENFFGRYIFVIVLLISGFLGISMAQEDVDSSVQDNIAISENEENKGVVVEEKTLDRPPENDSVGRNEFYNTIEQYSPIKVYIERVEAVMDYRNFEKAWELTADSLKQKRNGGSFENFIEFPERMAMAPGLYHIRSVEFKTPERLRIAFDLDVFMVKENGEWKFGGEYQEPEDIK